MSFVLHFFPVQLSVWHIILLTMQYDHSKRSLDHILVTPDLEKVEVICIYPLQPSSKCRLPPPFGLLAQVDKNVGRPNFVCNVLRDSYCQHQMFHFRLNDHELNLFTWIECSFVFCCSLFNLMKQKFQESSALDKLLVLYMQTCEAF